MSLHERVAAVIIEALELEDVTPQTLDPGTPLFAPAEADGLELDSIGALEIVACLADEFGYDFEDIGRDDMVSVEAIAAFITRKGLVS